MWFSPILIELLLVLCVVMGWGIWELRSLARLRKRDEAERARVRGREGATANDAASEREASP